jgi:hypothetical protein
VPLMTTVASQCKSMAKFCFTNRSFRAPGLSTEMNRAIDRGMNRAATGRDVLHTGCDEIYPGTGLISARQRCPG